MAEAVSPRASLTCKSPPSETPKSFAAALGTAVGKDRDKWVSEARSELIDEKTKRGERSLKCVVSGEEVLDGFIDTAEKGITMYFMGRLPGERELRGCLASPRMSAYALHDIWYLGKGFFGAMAGSVEAKTKLLDGGAQVFKGTLVHFTPYTSKFDPESILNSHSPVWIGFPKLPGALRPVAKSIANELGQVLFVPKKEEIQSILGPRFCILWEMDKPVPEEVMVVAKPIGEIFIKVKFQPFPHACFKCNQLGHQANGKEWEIAASSETTWYRQG